MEIKKPDNELMCRLVTWYKHLLYVHKIHRKSIGSSLTNSIDNKGSWRILKDLYCSVTMLRELGLMGENNGDVKSTINPKWNGI